jgi:hypothetical protein
MAKRVWFLLALAAAARVLSIWVLTGDSYFELVPRSLMGRALLAMPTWLDLAVPLVVCMTLWHACPGSRLTVRTVGLAGADAAGLLAFPLLTGLALFAYVQRWLVSLQVNWASLLQWVHFGVAFLAINLVIDALPAGSRWGRRLVAALAGLTLAITQGLSATMDSMTLGVGLFCGVGATLALAVLAFRPTFRQSPSRAVLAAVIVGGVACFVIIAARSESLFTIGVPFLALLIGAVAIRSPKVWPRWAALAGMVALCLGLSLGVPRLVPPEVAATLVENVQPALKTEQAGTITVRFEDARVRDFAVRAARLLERANAVSREQFGVSPDAKELTIRGIAPGGFYAEFPHGIVGNLASERHLLLSLDAAYLDAPGTSVHFPDPVNAILHEYSHLYGVVPFTPWIMGPEEEGWATYAATRLALRLFAEHGPGLWDPPYDYAERARSITRSNLAGHPVAWSHASEFGGFRLWHALGERDGEAALFRERWGLTQRELERFVLMINDPKAARRLAEAMGLHDFVAHGAAEPVRYDRVIATDDWMTMAAITDMTPEQAKAVYAARAGVLVRPAVIVPAAPPWKLDLLAALATVALAAWWRRAQRMRAAAREVPGT